MLKLRFDWYIMYCYSIEKSEIQKKEKRSANKYGSHFEYFWVCLQVFVLWGLAGMEKFRAKFEVLLQNNFGQSLPLISLEIRLFCRELNSGKRGNSLSVFHRNSPKYSNDQRGKLDWNWLKFYGERNTGFPAITAPRLQTMKQTLATSKHSIEFTYSDFPGHFKVNCD